MLRDRANVILGSAGRSGDLWGSSNVCVFTEEGEGFGKSAFGIAIGDDTWRDIGLGWKFHVNGSAIGPD